MTEPKKRGRPRKIHPDEIYFATVKVMGKTFESEGLSIREAIEKLSPPNCKGKSILTIKKERMTIEKILMPPLTFRLFNTRGFSREVALKNVCTIFGGK